MTKYTVIENGEERSFEIDLGQYACERCGTMGVTEAGMNIFVGSLCPACFWNLWKDYLRDTSEPRREWTDEQAHAALGDDYDHELRGCGHTFSGGGTTREPADKNKMPNT